MQKELFLAGKYDEYRCESCGELLDSPADIRDDDECIHCYTNYDCPAGCSEEHDEPSPDRYGQWRCPYGNDLFTLNNGEWEPQPGRYPDRSTYIDLAGEWLIWPDEEGYEFCENCAAWRYSDDMVFNRWGDPQGCGSCRSSYSDDEYGIEPHSMTPRCEQQGCTNTNLTQWHPITEQVACDGHTLAGYEPVPTLVNA